MNNRLDSAVSTLITDRAVLSEFRRNPAAAMRRFELSDCELDALMSGDEQSLLAHGLSPDFVTGKPQAPHWFAGLFGTVARRMAAPAVMAVLLALAIQGGGAPDASASASRARTRVRTIRESGPAGLRAKKTPANVRALSARARVRTRHSYLAGVRTALSQFSCERCSPSD